MFVGIDCGTQGTKAVVLDPARRRVIGEGYARHELIAGEKGRREQHPQWWVEALKTALAAAIAQAGISAKSIVAIGVSGQQHGLVLLGADGEPLRSAKLWCDVETNPQNEALLKALGGNDGSIDAIGNVLATGYTASKIRWVMENEPDLFAKVRHVLLPHDYLNFWLTGAYACEYGDASGTGYFDVRTRGWSDKMLAELDPSGALKTFLPPFIAADAPVGIVRKQVADELGLSDNVIVASGGGDNMMGAIGTGNVREGIVTMGLGTSGVVYAYSATPVVDASGCVATFCSSTNGWMPLICTMNVTGALESVRQLLGLDLAAVNHHLDAAPIGAGGLTLMPFFNGERTPALPTATASLNGATTDNFTPANLVRATIEGASFGLRYGLELLGNMGITATEIRLIGGGSKSPGWRQMIADLAGVPVVCPVEGEAGALGAALQAVWCHETAKSAGSVSLETICDSFVMLDHAAAVQPRNAAVAAYQTLYDAYKGKLKEQYGI